MGTQTETSASTARTTTRNARALTVVAAAALGLLAWLVLGPIAGIDLDVRTGSSGTQQVGPVSVVATGLLVGLAGWGLLAVLERRTAKARTAWTVTAAVVLLLSLTGPLGAVTTAGKLSLVVLHLVVGVVLIAGLRRTAGR